jgi:hypothetical protein
MPLDNIIDALEAERDNLTRAIDALRGSQTGRKAGRPAGRRLSAAAKAKIAAAMRRTWAERKKRAKVA